MKKLFAKRNTKKPAEPRPLYTVKICRRNPITQQHESPAAFSQTFEDMGAACEFAQKYYNNIYGYDIFERTADGREELIYFAI